MTFDNSIKNILNESKILENKILNFKSKIVQKEDFLIFEKNQFDLFIDTNKNIPYLIDQHLLEKDNA